MFKDKTFLFIFVSLLLLILDYFSLLSFIKGGVEEVILPIKQNVFTSVTSVTSVGNILTHYQNFSKVLEENGKLKREKEELQLKVQTFSEENNALRNQVGSGIGRTISLTPAVVISVSRFMEIGIGETSGVKRGMVALSGSYLVGKIVEVTPFRSQVMLLTDPEIRVPSKTSRGTKGVVQGQSYQTILLDLVLQKDPLFLEDQVVTSGEENFPPNMLMGTVAHITSDDVSVYKQAKVNQIIDYRTLSVVFVAKSI